MLRAIAMNLAVKGSHNCEKKINMVTDNNTMQKIDTETTTTIFTFYKLQIHPNYNIKHINKYLKSLVAQVLISRGSRMDNAKSCYRNSESSSPTISTPLILLLRKEI